ncbi:MAG: bifunctional DNA-formamidopyrimidine glycosylase/DNA-(apurinic or apyrimidinic site) lyase [Planctomycetota bacterium]|jgi:formamidopyrimidine-DNA glycosylase|nr:bifunctional DNA-formamidopyrimidine glycosylase/DNA-(apurinic or apyrimidinic site) lyase [Planctomycetota bacterium]
MPELPEVETTRRGIQPHVEGSQVTDLVVRNRNLRQPVPTSLKRLLKGREVRAVKRRAKYLLFEFEHGHVLVHLGMSGSLCLVDPRHLIRKHDHLDLHLSSGKVLRYHDPRRFGLWLWTSKPLDEHALLHHLGPEPLSEDFDGEMLFGKSRKRKVAVKNFLMDGKIVVGIGNIYAAEALFQAGIRPTRQAGRVTRAQYQRLAEASKRILTAAIEQGGTTLQDFVGGDGEPGYFAQDLAVYGREGEPCGICGTRIRGKTIGQRASCFCPKCQV